MDEQWIEKKRKTRSMKEPFPLLKMSYEQISLFKAQLLVYQQYLQRKVAPSTKRNRSLRILVALIRRLNVIWIQTNVQVAFLLTVEEVLIIKEALTVLQHILETKPPSPGLDQEIEHLAIMKKLIDSTFPTIEDESTTSSGGKDL
jgi:hypothetical protein